MYKTIRTRWTVDLNIWYHFADKAFPGCVQTNTRWITVNSNVSSGKKITLLTINKNQSLILGLLLLGILGLLYWYLSIFSNGQSLSVYWQVTYILLSVEIYRVRKCIIFYLCLTSILRTHSNGIYLKPYRSFSIIKYKM